MKLRALAPALAAVTALSLLATAPAQASTMPELGLSKGRAMMGLGVLGGSYDLALSDQLSVGGVASAWGGFGVNALSLGARGTYLLAKLDHNIQLGVTGGLGASVVGAAGFGATSLAANVGPTVRWPLPIPLLGGQQVILRAGLDIGIPLTGGGLGWSPDVELAWRFNKNEEWTVGGGTLVGWRKFL
ncbi:MAG: hypothetical protein VKP62_12315 [Candidatus Sericytochromatia bacterium]|nr:hypothetical protein [Candidatus Sericytochromatia bacterium]